MVVYEKTDFEAQKNKEDIYPKNNIAQLYFIQGWSNLHGNFSSWLRDASDFQHSTWSSPTSSWKICKYQIHPQVYWENSHIGRIIGLLYFLCFKICFLIHNHCKRLNVFSDPLKMTRIFWTLLRVCLNKIDTFLVCWEQNLGMEEEVDVLLTNCFQNNFFLISRFLPSTNQELLHNNFIIR